MVFDNGNTTNLRQIIELTIAIEYYPTAHGIVIAIINRSLLSETSAGCVISFSNTLTKSKIFRFFNIKVGDEFYRAFKTGYLRTPELKTLIGNYFYGLRPVKTIR